MLVHEEEVDVDPTVSGTNNPCVPERLMELTVLPTANRILDLKFTPCWLWVKLIV